MFFVTDPDNEISAIGGTAVRGNRVDLPIEPIEAGQVRIAVPDPAIEWSIQLRILIPTDRVAYYDIVLAPPG